MFLRCERCERCERDVVRISVSDWSPSLTDALTDPGDTDPTAPPYVQKGWDESIIITSTRQDHNMQSRDRLGARVQRVGMSLSC